MQYCQPPYRLENVMRLIAFCLEKLLYRHKPSHTKEKGTGDSISSIWSPPDIAMDRIQRNGSGDFGRHHHNALASGNGENWNRFLLSAAGCGNPSERHPAGRGGMTGTAAKNAEESGKMPWKRLSGFALYMMCFILVSGRKLK